MKTHQSIIVVALSCLLLLVSACGKKSIRGVSGVEESASHEETVAAHINEQDVSNEPLMPFDEALSADNLDAGVVQALSSGDFHDGQVETALVGKGQESPASVFPGSISSQELGASTEVHGIEGTKGVPRALPRDQLMASGNTGAHDNVRGNVTDNALEHDTDDVWRNGTDDSEDLRDIFFDYDSWRLSEQSHQTLEANAKWLKSHPYARITIEGHCDQRGTQAYNYVLGKRRAETAKWYLLHLGVSARQMTVVSYGKDRPVCHVFSKACLGSNRRAHFSMDLNLASRE